MMKSSMYFSVMLYLRMLYGLVDWDYDKATFPTDSSAFETPNNR